MRYIKHKKVIPCHIEEMNLSQCPVLIIFNLRFLVAEFPPFWFIPFVVPARKAKLMLRLHKIDNIHYDPNGPSGVWFFKLKLTVLRKLLLISCNRCKPVGSPDVLQVYYRAHLHRINFIHST